MGAYGFAVFCLNLKLLVGIFFILSVHSEDGTNPQDVAAITSLHAALGYPNLPGWIQNGSPCSGGWQGVSCDLSNIVSIIINGANLGGELGTDLGSFSSIKIIDLSNNHIGGAIPSKLPLTLEKLFLSDNNFTGNIPDSLSSLPNLLAMSLNNNHLSGKIPDSFEGLVHLVNLDLFSNNLSGRLPPSLRNLSLMTLHLQNNQLSGTLDVLQDLPLTELNIENNQFSGPIPQKLLAIPNFMKDGNPLNGSIAPSPPPTPSIPPSASPPTPSIPPSASPPTPSIPPFASPPTPSKPPSAAPHFIVAPMSAPAQPNTASGPGVQTYGQSPAEGPMSKKNKSSGSTKRIVWISIVSIISCIVLVLAALLCLPKRLWERKGTHDVVKKALEAVESNVKGKLSKLASPVKPYAQVLDVLKPIPSGRHETIMSIYDKDEIPPPPPPPIPQPPKEVTDAQQTIVKHSMTQLPPSYSVADLQQYTNSFSEDNVIGEGTLGKVFKAELPDGRLLAVKKLNKRVRDGQNDEEFLALVSDIDRIRHDNVVQLDGYCAEHGERLLVYEYCREGTLHNALHTPDKELSWNMRINLALGAAKALEYLHETCDPPVVHRNFKSSNILLDHNDDGDLVVHISDCGLAPLMSSGDVSQLSGQLLTTYGYSAPEFESGIYTLESDVYSFGVVMLELLTGRLSYDRSLSGGEQSLVRWASPQLYDINALKMMVDPSLKGDYNEKSLSNFADIISSCVQKGPGFRPQMSHVVLDIIKMMDQDLILRAERLKARTLDDLDCHNMSTMA
ncbi:unnamed protein product [Cuscuta epithymum]|uniref:Protein kinase domain-containing protein n=3 Tax=Cuscuta epithymum TaxID=186058 RepID=A0AAV0EUB4_9ASTE|nr:unnamed protein product [Cuscuta epithymum]